MAHRHSYQLPVTQQKPQPQSVAHEFNAKPAASISDFRAEARISEQVPIISPSPSITSQIVPVPVLIADSHTVTPLEGNRTRGSDAVGAAHDGSRKRKRKRKHRQRHHHMKNRRLRAERRHNHNRDHHHTVGRHENRICRHRLIDHCSWPQCNRACPRLYNPLTGKLHQPVPPLISP